MSHFGVTRGSGGRGAYPSAVPGGRGRGGGPRGGGAAGAATGGYPPMPPPPPMGYGGYGEFDPSYGAAAAYGGGYGMHPGFPGFPPQEMPSPLDTEIQCVLGEIHAELTALESSEQAEQFRNSRRLLNSEKERLENNIDPEWIEVDIPKPVKVVKKILVPTYRHPNFNFVGKVLGPKGATLQNLCKTHKCHIYILGRGSTKDREKEAELLASGDPQHVHYGGPLHVKVETVAPAYIAYSRVSAVIEELSRILQPIHEDTTPAHLKNAVAAAAAAGTGTNGKDGSAEGGEEVQKTDAGESGDGENGGGGSTEGGAGAGGAQRGGRGGGMRGRGYQGGRGGYPGGYQQQQQRGRGRGGQPVGFRPY